MHNLGNTEDLCIINGMRTAHEQLGSETDESKSRYSMLYPGSRHEGMRDRLSYLVDTFGEYGDYETEPGVIRKVSFAYPRQTGEVRVTEIVDQEDLDGPSAFRIERDDFRGRAEAVVSDQQVLGRTTMDAIQWDLDLYAHEKNAELYKRRMGSAINWLVQLPLALNAMRPSIKRRRVFDQEQQYETDPFRLTKERRKELHRKQKQEDKQADEEDKRINKSHNL